MSPKEKSAKDLATSLVNSWHLQQRRAYEGTISRNEAISLAGMFMDEALSNSEQVDNSGGIERVMDWYLSLYEKHLFTCPTCRNAGV